MTRVLQIVDCMDLGGIQTFIMNTYREIVNHGIQYDFMVFHDRKQYFEDEITALGGKTFKLPSRRDGWIKSRKAIEHFFDNHSDYKVVHYHTSSLSYLDPLAIAAKMKIPVRIVHSHSTNAPGSRFHYYLHKLNKRRIADIATLFFACGDLAGKWMFEGSGCEDKVQLINNGIDMKKYTYNEQIRDRIRTQLGINNEFVIGHVGRFSTVKNHSYLLEVFADYLKMANGNSRLLLVGDGELRSQMEEYAKQLGLCDYVIFLGARRDVPQLLQAMDYMIMPSIYEGFPVTAVEAQASGLPCLLSDTITKDAAIKSNVKMLSIKENPSIWAQSIDKTPQRIPDNTELIKAGYDMKQTVDKLYDVYVYGSAQ